MNPVAADQVGWTTYTEQVARAWARVDASETAVFTSNYGEAGALARYGPALGVPAPYSGHNELGLGCDVVDRLDNGVGVDTEEQDAPLAVCTGRKEPWAQVWPRLRHLD
jgi:hypothetical protein